MKALKILFLYPNHKGVYMLPPAIGILSACLKREGHKVELFDTTQYTSFELDHRPTVDVDKSKSDRLMAKPYDVQNEKIKDNDGDIFADWVNKVNSFNPDLIALSATEDLWLPGIALLKRTRHKNILTVAGGVFCTFAPDLAISYPEIDIVCKGEGEIALVELCNRLSKNINYDDITNLWIKKEDGHLIKNGLDQVNMDENPLIDLSVFEEERYYRPMTGTVYRMFPVEIFRGCPYTCRYCNSPWQSELYKKEANTNFLRRKSFDKIKEELSYYKKMKAEYLYFWSDTFFSWKKEDFLTFCEIYEEINLPFWIQTRPETVRFDLFKKLKEIGCHRISFGVEHGNYDFRNKVLGRRVTNQRLIDSLNIVYKVGIPFSVNNIIGFPEETYEMAFDTIELNRQIPADDRNAYPFIPFHGIPLRKDCDQLGLTKYEDIVESMVGTGSILDMPQFAKTKVMGLCKTFNLYVSFPKSRWPEIKIAEENNDEGQRVFENLKEEFKEKYLYKDSDSKFMYEVHNEFPN